MGDTNRQLLLEKMKRRRAAMEASIVSDGGSYKSDTEDTLRRTQTPGGAALSPAPADTTTEIETFGPGTDTVVETLEDVGHEEDMLQDLQARRQQKKEEIQRTMDSSGGAWGEPIQPTGPATLSTGGNESPGPGLQRVEGRGLSESATTQSLNLNASIRDRLRSKVRGRQARTPLQETIPERRLRGLRDRPLPTRFDDAGLLAPPGPELGEEDQAAELQASIASVNRWKKIGLLSKQKADGMPSEEEAYNFFVGSMEDTPEEQPAEGTPEESVEVPEGDSLTFWGKPPYTRLAKQLEEEDKLYMVPSLRPIPLDQKVPEGQSPRCWEEEGFYVGKPPQVAYTNLNIMENRLNENRKELWFGEDGQLKRLANPVKEKPSRPPLLTTEEPDELLETEWIKAIAEPFDGKFINGTGDQRNQYQLDVDVSTLSFLHHPLFSREHVLASRLTQLYKQFCQRRQKATSAHLTDKVRALKITLQQLQDNAGNLGNLKTKSTVTDVTKRIQEYRKQVIKTRDLRDAEDRFDRELLVNILNCWRDIKLVREQQGYVNTPVKTVVRKENTDREEDERLLEEELGEELQERREEYEAEYQEVLATYENDLRDWKRLMKRRKKRLEQRATEEGEESRLVNEEEPAPVRPAKPEDFDEAAVYTELKEKANKCRRRPGEPILSPELHHSVSITPLDQCPRPEKLRRQEAQNWTCYVKVLFNDKEVSRTSTKRLTSEFSIHFGEIHNIRIVQWPESIKLQVIEAGMQSKLVADVYLPIPETSVVSSRVELDSQEFSSSGLITYKHEGVGSGTVFEPVITANNEEDEGRTPQTLLTSGTLMSSASWAVDSDGRPLAPPLYNETNISMVKRYDAMAALGAAGIVDIQKLSKWIAESHLDPNDPANANIMSIIKISKTQWEGGEGLQYFRVNQLEEETELVTQFEMSRSKRFKLIQLRDQGVPEFKNYKMVPSRDRDIPDNIFETYEKRLRGDEEEVQEDEIPSHRGAVTKFLNKVREEVTKRSLIAKRQLELKDMIVEDEVPDIGTLGVRIGQLFAPRRPLRPVRRERKIVGAQNLTVSDVKVLINVVRAVDIPVRMESQQTVNPRGVRTGFGAGASNRRDQFSASTSGYRGPSAGTQSTGAAMAGGAEIRPFVEAVFQGNFARTSVAESANPSWNEELVLPFRAPNNDYSPENLQTVNDVVYLNLFDEIVIDILQDDRLRTTNVHQRLERHWLGGIEIPFSTIYFNNKVEGTMKVNTPPVLLGYRRQGRGGVQTVQGIASRNDTLLTLFATIEPPLQPSQQMPERFESSEEDKLLRNAQLWLEPLKKKFPKREFKLLATDLNGKKVFIPRYIRPQKPPEDLLIQSQEPQQTKEMERIARFVSFIPYVSDSAAFPDLCDIWATSDQFLHMLAGDEEEHAILLCNYFKYRNRAAYVVLGTGIPEGSTAYVLTLDDGYRLWNAYTGEQFDVHDANCPLKSIGCVFNEENLWANIQEWDEPYRLSFDFSRPKHWQPFFSKKYPRPSLTSVQKEILDYKEVDQDYVKTLQEKIEKTLRDKIMSWRPRFVTRWNRYCNQAFRNMLNSIEQNLGHRSVENHSPELDQILASYKLSGFPINMSFTDVGPVLESVFSTGVHTTEDPDVEFALAVHIHPYPHGVLSLWVYVGTLRRKVGY